MRALRHAEPVMGTVVSFDVRDAGPGTADGLRRAVDWLHRVDAVFSTYRADSQISRLGRGELALADCDPDVAEVLALGAAAERDSGGWFSVRPAGADGPLDPSGVVKGWAVERASAILRAAGSVRHSVNGGGDVQTAGSPNRDAAGTSGSRTRCTRTRWRRWSAAAASPWPPPARPSAARTSWTRAPAPR